MKLVSNLFRNLFGQYLLGCLSSQSWLKRFKPKQSKDAFLRVVKIYFIAGFSLVLICITSKLFGVQMHLLTADPAEIAHQPPYIGLLSNIGNLLWCGTSAICLFSAHLTRLDPEVHRKWSPFLFFSAFFTGFLMLDDLFQLHEFYPVLFFGVNFNLSNQNRALQNLMEGIFFACYFGCFVFYLLRFRYQIQRTEYFFLVIAFCFFGLSIGIDLTPHHWFKWHDIVEDSFKLLGIVSWLTYFATTCGQIIEQLNHAPALESGQLLGSKDFNSKDSQ
jgi:hypothetical protein